MYTGRCGGISCSRWPSCPSGMWSAPGMRASTHSSGSRTSTTLAPCASTPANVSMSTSGASGFGWPIVMPTVSRSWLQSLHSPPAAGALVPHAVVQPADPRLPQLDGQRPHAVAAPPRRQRHLGALEAGRHLRQLLLEHATRGDRIALRRRPRAELAVERPGSEVFDGF